MNFVFSIYSIPVLFSALISGVLMIWSWRRRQIQGATWFALLMLFTFMWATSYYFELSSPNFATAYFWSKVQYFTAPGLTIVWLLMVMVYTGQQEYITRKNIVLLFIIPFISMLMAWTNDFHQLLWVAPHLDPHTPFTTVVFDIGIWYWINTIYAYLGFIISTVMLITSYARSIALYRRQIIILMVFSGLVWVSNVIYLFGDVASGLNLSPLTFSIGGLVLAWGIFRYRILNIMPIANDLIVDIIEDAIVVLDTENRILNLNPAAEKLVGRKISDAVGLYVQDTTVSWDKLKPYFETFEATRAEIELPLHGQPSFINLRVTPIKAKDGNCIGRLVIVRNITARKKTEAQLHILSRAVEESATTVVVTNVEGSIEYANPAFSKITGYTREEAIGQNPNILKSGEHPPEYYAKMWETISRGDVWRGDVINKKKNGELYWEASTIAPVHNENNEITHYVAVKADITERIKAEKQLRIARDKAVQDSLAKTQMLANVSHELRTPLGAILGFSELFQMKAYGETTPQQDKTIEDVIKNTHYIINLVDDLLDQARSDADTIKLNTQPINTKHLIQHIESKMGFLAQEKALELFINIRDGVPPVLLGDELRLQQIAVNLLNNAIKFTENGSVSLTLSRPNAHQWMMQVSDTGIGIPKDQQDLVFEAFRQVDESSKTNISGVGLGLSIVKKLVTLMNGEISLDSDLGKGSTFTVILPLMHLKE